MATLRDIRRKILSVGNIRKITQAMELVAASRLRKAQTKMESSYPYAQKLKETLDLLIHASDELHHPLVTSRKIKKTGLVVIAGDRGLCGGYNQSVFTAAEKFLRNYEPSQVELIPVGRKTLDHFETKKWKIMARLGEWGGKLTYHQVEEFTKNLISFYLNGELDEIWLLYTHFINMSAREVRIEKLLNVDVSKPTIQKTDNYIFEPDASAILAELLPHYCIAKMQSTLNDAYVAELAARISSMRVATKNAEELIERLTLIRNKVRQAGITRELIEITSGAENLR